jgi:hypothetical protein
MFYTKQHDMKSTYQNIGVRVDAYNGSLTFTVSRFLSFDATELMQPRVLQKTNMGSLALTLTVRDISRSLSS